MHFKTNRLNHDFQIVHFLAGSCHTPDGAFGLLCDLLEDRSNAVKMQAVADRKAQARTVRAQSKLGSSDEAERLEAEAELLEIEALAQTCGRNLAAALAEVATIERCIAALEPLRRFRHLPVAEAHEAAQREEWRLELIWRAENHLLTTGTIPTDHFATMRQHPDFAAAIWPAVQEVRARLSEPKGPEELVARMTSGRFEFLRALELTSDQAPAGALNPSVFPAPVRCVGPAPTK